MNFAKIKYINFFYKLNAFDIIFQLYNYQHYQYLSISIFFASENILFNLATIDLKV